MIDRNPFRRVREDPVLHWFSLLVAVVLGLGLSAVHWVGLVAGGALVGLVSTTLRRALLSGLGFGVAVILVWLTSLGLAGSLGNVLAMGELTAIGVLVALVCPVIGSLLRGVV